MKDINFIKTLSAKDQHGLHRWITFSVSMIVLIIIAIALLQIPQLHTFNQIKKEYQQLTRAIHNVNTQITQNQNLKSKMYCLGGQCKTIDNLACATQKYHTCMQCITNACSNIIALQTCNVQNKKLTLTAQCAHVQQAIHFVEQLAQQPTFANVQLLSLQPMPGSLVAFKIKGTINS